MGKKPITFNALCVVSALALLLCVRSSYLSLKFYELADCAGDVWIEMLEPIGVCSGYNSVYSSYVDQGGVIKQLTDCTDDQCSVGCTEADITLDTCVSIIEYTVVNTALQTFTSNDYIEMSTYSDVDTCSGTSTYSQVLPSYPCIGFNDQYLQIGVNNGYLEMRINCADNDCTTQCLTYRIILDNCVYGSEYSITDASGYDSIAYGGALTVQIYDSNDCSDATSDSYQIPYGLCQGSLTSYSKLDVDNGQLKLYSNCEDFTCSTGCTVQNLQLNECYNGYQYSYEAAPSDPDSEETGSPILASGLASFALSVILLFLMF